MTPTPTPTPARQHIQQGAMDLLSFVFLVLVLGLVVEAGCLLTSCMADHRADRANTANHVSATGLDLTTFSPG